MSRLSLALTDAAEGAVRDPDLVSALPVTLLFALDMDGPLRPTGIQELTGLSSGGVTKLVERLEGRGLVVRRTGAIEDDRRGVSVEITRRGRNTVRTVADAMVGAMKEAEPVTSDLAAALGRSTTG